MPQITTITALDRETVPVSHSFAPKGIPSGIATYVEPDAAGTLIGEKVLTISSTTSATKRKVRMVLKDPVVVTETINGVDLPKVDRVAYAEINLSFDINSTQQERDNLVGIASNIIADAAGQFSAIAVDNQGVY